MRLEELIAGVSTRVRGDASAVEISGLAYDSREVKPGELFFCVSGFRSDGHDFAAQAVARGAAALVAERALDLGVPELLVGSVRGAMGPLAARFFGHPTAELRVVGVTGTNGKTTVVTMVTAMLNRSGRAAIAAGNIGLPLIDAAPV